MSQLSLYVSFGVLAAWELYFFLMQRAALDLSRSAGIAPQIGREILPPWFTPAVYAARLPRWVLLFLIWRTDGWIACLLAEGLLWLAVGTLPVPYGHFFPMFRRKIGRDVAEGRVVHDQELVSALSLAESQADGGREPSGLLPQSVHGTYQRRFCNDCQRYYESKQVVLSLEPDDLDEYVRQRGLQPLPNLVAQIRSAAVGHEIYSIVLFREFCPGCRDSILHPHANISGQQLELPKYHVRNAHAKW